MADFEEPIIRFTKLIDDKGPIPGIHGILCYKTYLIGSDDELLLVYRIFSSKFKECDMVSNFEIYRFDRLKSSWMKVKNIGKRTIFLSGNEGKCRLISDVGIKENSIYFTRYRNLYVFDLNDQSITVSVPCPKVSKNLSHLYWIW